MSRPLWLSLHLIPYLDDITPEIGFIKLTPRLVGTLVSPVTTLVPIFWYALVLLGFFVTTTFFSYSSETHVSTVLNSAFAVSYFSTIPSLSVFALFLLFKLFITFSASENDAT